MNTSIRRSRAATPLPAFLVVAFLAAGIGCSTKFSVDVSRSAAADFSQYRSWSWILVVPEDQEPINEDERALSTLVIKHVSREFFERGFTYRRGDADLGVDARIMVSREQHVTNRTSAVESLHSFHSTPSYEIQATETEVVDYERGRLLIRVLDLRRNRVVWRGEYNGRFPDSFTSHVEAAVASTLESFPAVPEAAPVADAE
jgi:hypothetical protein